MTRVPSSRPVQYTAVFVVLLCGLIIGGEFWRSLAARESQQRESEIAATNLAKSVADYASSTFIQADVVLAGLVDRVENDGLTPSSLDRIAAVLRLRKRELPQFERLSIVDADGRWIATHDDALDGLARDDEQEYFRYHRSHADSAPHLGPPIRSRTGNAWIVTVSRRFARSDGSFGGVAVASIRLAYFSDYFARFNVGRQGSIVLTTSNGVLINRMPFKDSLIGADLSQGSLFRDHIAYDATGTAWITSLIDGVERLTAYQALDAFPAYAIASFGRDEVFASWKADMLVHLGATLLLVGLLAGIGSRLIAVLAARHEDQLALIESRRQLEAAYLRASELAHVDALTGVANRRAFDRAYDEEFRRARRMAEPLAVLMIDVDRFKDYNDALGHGRGDDCLGAIAAVLRATLRRPGDFVARYGGEEFVVLLPATDADGALGVAATIRAALHDRALPHPTSAAGVVTVSIGASVVGPDQPERSAASVLADADRALYAAKKCGRDNAQLQDGVAPARGPSGLRADPVAVAEPADAT